MKHALAGVQPGKAYTVKFRVGVAASPALVFDVDPETGDLAYVADGDAHWVSAETGRDRKLERR